jgi:hypothetical protein
MELMNDELKILSKEIILTNLKLSHNFSERNYDIHEKSKQEYVV